jgi:catechol 2,3-dioxygenase-like lactoylglutathione lyase family enzyme
MPRLADAARVLGGDLGGVLDTGGEADVFRWGCWRFAGGGRVEVIEPRGADGFLHRFLARRGPGIHHVTFTVPSLRAACARALARGYRVVGYDDSDPGWATAFLHPKEALGLVVQLAQPGERRAAHCRPAPFAPSDAAPPVRIWGLRTRCRSRERAQILWGTVLGAEIDVERRERLTCLWPGSPMRVGVDVDTGAEDGPVAIEFESERVVVVRADAPAAFGAVLTQRPDDHR